MALIGFFDPKSCNGDIANASGEATLYFSRSPTITTAGRNGDEALTCSVSASCAMQFSSSSTTSGTYWFGFHLYPTGNFNSNANTIVLRDGLTTGVVRGGLTIETNGTLSWFAGSSVQGTSGLAISLGQHYFILIRLVLSASAAGSVDIWVNGVQFLSASSINTVSNLVNTVVFSRSGGTGSIANYDVIAVWDESGDVLNGSVGTLRTEYRVPDTDVQAQFTPSAGSDNYAMVEQADGDSSYNEAASDGLKDILSIPLDTIDDTILAVKAYVQARQDGVGVSGITPSVISNSSEISGSLASPGGSYTTYVIQLEENPDTGNPWEEDDDLKVGYLATA